MKEKDVVIGRTYQTYVGQNLVRVVVVAKREGMKYSSNSQKSRDTFTVRRTNESRPLPKGRTAAALRECPLTRTDDVSGAALPVKPEARIYGSGDNFPGM